MLPYYAELFERAFWAIPGLLGSNALGLLWPVVLVICGETIACVVYGFRTMYERRQRASLIGLASLIVCYSALFEWSIIATNYRDHADVTSKNRTLQTALDSATFHEQKAVLLAENECAETVGEKKALAAQNREQQNTINNCQTEAIKLLEPKQLAVYVYDLGNLLGSSQEQTEKVKSPILLMVNKPVTPVTIVANCTTPIDDLQAFAVAPEMASTLQLSTSQNGPNSIVANISSPALTPEAPFIVMLTHKKSDMLHCHFNVQ